MLRILVVVLVLFSLIACESDKKAKVIAPEVDQIERVSFGNKYDSITKLIEQDLDNAELYYQRYMVLFDDNELEQAMIDINIAIDLDSLQGKFYVGKANIYIEQKEIGKAKGLLDEKIAVTPGSTEIMLKISEIYLWAGEYQKTITWANTALDFDKYMGQAYYLKGMAHQYSNDTVKAVTSLQTAVEQDPNHYNAFMQLGKLYALEKHELADAYFSNAINAKPKSIEAYYARGLHRQNMNNAKGALQDYNSILEMEQDHVPAQYNIGYVKLILEEKVDTAKMYFEKVVNLSPEYADAVYMLGYCLELEGKNAEALTKYKQTLKLQDTHTLAAKGLNRLQ